MMMKKKRNEGEEWLHYSYIYIIIGENLLSYLKGSSSLQRKDWWFLRISEEAIWLTFEKHKKEANGIYK